MSASPARFCAIDGRGRHLETASLQIGTIKDAKTKRYISMAYNSDFGRFKAASSLADVRLWVRICHEYWVR